MSQTRVLGLDYGTRRVGAAISDPRRIIATPLEVYHRRDSVQDAKHYQTLVEEHEVDLVVIGLPIHSTGGESALSKQARAWGKWLGDQVKIPIRFFDERNTSLEADEILMGVGYKIKDRKSRRDMLAAQILLRNFLDAGCPVEEAAPVAIHDPLPERALIVGCGFLGKAVGTSLAQQGLKVFGTSRNLARTADYQRAGIELVRGNVLDSHSWDRLPTLDRIFYAVGYDRTQGVPMRDVYVDGLKSFLDRLDQPIGRFVYASSTSVYGLESGDWVDESTPTSPRNSAGAVVLEAETLLREWSARTETPVVILRFSGLYGPGRIIGKSALQGGLPLQVDPDGWLNLIHRDDAAEVAARAILHDAPDNLYVVSDDRPITRREYYETAAQVLGTSAPRFAPDNSDKGSRRVANHKMKRDLLDFLVYPDIVTGLPASIEDEAQAT